MKISHLSEQVLGIINMQRGTQRSCKTPGLHSHTTGSSWWGALPTELFSRDKSRRGESRSDRAGARGTARAVAAACPAPAPHCLQDARGCAWPSRQITAPASPDCRADGQQMPGSSTERGGIGWDAGFWASVENKHALLAAREPVIKHS